MRPLSYCRKKLSYSLVFYRYSYVGFDTKVSVEALTFALFSLLITFVTF